MPLPVWPAGLAQPPVSNLNVPGPGAIPNVVVVPVGANGEIDLATAVGSTQVIVDVAGYFAPSR